MEEITAAARDSKLARALPLPSSEASVSDLRRQTDPWQSMVRTSRYTGG